MLIQLWALATLLTLAACAPQPERLWLNTPGWSRALLAGNTRVGDPVPLAFGPQGQVVLFWIGAEPDAPRLRLLALDRRAQVLWQRAYEEINITRPGQPSIVSQGDTLQLFWLDGATIHTTRLNLDGELLEAPVPLSAAHPVGEYALSQDQAGRIALWYGGTAEAPGIYALPPGDLQGTATLVDPAGRRPEIQFDDQGVLHAIWVRYPPGPGDKPIFYGAYPGGRYEAGRAVNVITPRLLDTSVMEGPHLGLDRAFAYIFWSLSFYSGIEAGTTRTQYTYLQKGNPGAIAPPRVLNIPYLYELPYQAVEAGALHSGDRVPLGPGYGGGTQFVTQVRANPGFQPELAIVFQARLAYLLRKTKFQIGALYFQDGGPTGYQYLSFTPSGSSRPAVFSDDQGSLYLTWLEKGALPGWMIYFASTAPDLQDALHNLTLDDLGRLSADIAFGMLSGAILIPMALTWLLPTFLALLAVSRLHGREETLRTPGALASVALALVVLWVFKLAFLPGMRSYVPFSAWLPAIPDWAALPLQAGVPLAIAVLALLFTWHYTRRKDIRSVYVFTLIYGAVDGLLTMAVYGVLIYSTF